MTILLDDEEPTATNAGLQITKRRVQTEGVQVFERFYFHPAMTAHLGETVEVRYDARRPATAEIVLPDFRTVTAETLAAVKSDDDFLDDAFELIQARHDLAKANGVNRILVAALYAALEIRGIYAQLSDPLALVNEKAKARDRYRQIEAQIREAIKKSEEK